MSTKTSKFNLTAASFSLFVSLVKDAPNWTGAPLYSGSKSMNGNLTDLKRKGLVEHFHEDAGDVWVCFTEAGLEVAKEVVRTERLELRVVRADGTSYVFEGRPTPEPEAPAPPAPLFQAQGIPYPVNSAMILAVDVEGVGHTYGPFRLEDGLLGAQGMAETMARNTGLWAEVRLVTLTNAWAVGRKVHP